MKTYTISKDGYYGYLFNEDLATKLWLGRVSPSREIGLENRINKITMDSMKSERNEALGSLTEEQREAIAEYDLKMDSFMKNHEIEVFSYTLRMAQELLLSKEEDKKE